MAVYSFFGFGGALVGPILFGALLDAAGGETARHAWLLAFAGLAAVGFAGVAVLRDTDANRDSAAPRATEGRVRARERVAPRSASSGPGA